MKSFKLDSTGDLEFTTDFDIIYINGKDELIQRLRINLTTWTNEWFDNKTYGIDYFTYLGFTGNFQLLLNDIQSILLSYEEILEVVELSYTTLERHLRLSISVRLTDASIAQFELEV